jgi:hypothetical protein
MKPGSNTKTALLAIFIALAAMAGNKKIPAMKKKTALSPMIQELNGGQLHVLLYPQKKRFPASANGGYTMQVRITTKLPVQQQHLLYMNYQLKNVFHIIRGTDTLLLDCSERIPGLSNREFIYTASFSAGAENLRGSRLRFCMNDTVTGLGSATIMLKNLYNNRP